MNSPATELRRVADWLDAHPMPEDVSVGSTYLSEISPTRLQLHGPPSSLPWWEHWAPTADRGDATHWAATVDALLLVWVGPPAHGSKTIADAYGVRP